jgi:hypothetical protein
LATVSRSSYDSTVYVLLPFLFFLSLASGFLAPHLHRFLPKSMNTSSVPPRSHRTLRAVRAPQSIARARFCPVFSSPRLHPPFSSHWYFSFFARTTPFALVLFFPPCDFSYTDLCVAQAHLALIDHTEDIADG